MQRQQRHEANSDEDTGECQGEERSERGRPCDARAELVGKLGGECDRVAELGVWVAAEVVGELSDDPLPARAMDAGTGKVRVKLG
jgi:hypothetical protein